ncbi:hypothetical protein Taro_042140 [Colocasia esculenta]|uniref:Uncharacterized protein n=1 Tax=Colocasia esculenta TaxID=4460 RepID=A0A843WVM7_COLES|nr:hypothetical protein [Colocasia esculenta]
MTSRGVRRGVSSRPQHPRVLQYFLHHHLWTTACSCKAWFKQCRPQAQTQAALQAQLQSQAQAPAPVPQEHGHGGPSIMERFKRMDPPSFKGKSQPLLAESWMREVEKIFRAIRRELMFGGPPYFALGTRMVLLRLVAFDHRTLDEALSAAYRQESEMDQYLEEKRAAQKRSAPPFQRQDRKKAVYQSPQHPVAATSQLAVTSPSPSFKPSDKKMRPHYGRTHGSTECWKLAGGRQGCWATQPNLGSVGLFEIASHTDDVILKGL